MKKKKMLLSLCISICLLAIAAVSSTLAWFTDADQKTNLFSMGHIDISLDETGNGTATSDGLTYEGVLPGDSLEKKPTITVDSESQDAYLRVYLTIESVNTAITEALVVDTLYMQDGSKFTDVWTAGTDAEGNSCYYFTNTENDGAVAPGATIEVFSTVNIPVSWDNTYTNSTFKIVISAQAIQKANLQDELTWTNGKISAWPDETITTYQPG